MDVKDILYQTYRTNLKDAEDMVKHFRETGDEENLKRAEADREKWLSKLQNK